MFKQEIRRLGDYLVSDPVKLMKAGPLLSNEYALSGHTPTQAQNAGIGAANATYNSFPAINSLDTIQSG